MSDREKVIKGLEHCIRESEHIDDNPCDGCPYFVSDQYGCERTQMEKDALAMLKEQEPVPYEMEGGGSNWYPVCGECHGVIDSWDSFCKHCGRPVKQT